MGIMLGDLTVERIEKRLGITFPDDIKIFMEKNHQDKVDNIQKGKWHCFDIPFCMACGDMETAMKIYNSVKNKSHEAKEVLTFSINKDND